MRLDIRRFTFFPLVLSLSFVSGAFGTNSEFFKTSDGVRLHYLEAGAGSTIIFIPGWTMPADIWEPQIFGLSKNYRVIALDPRSQGDSEKTTEGNFSDRRAQDIRELIEHLQLSPVVLVGWSLGVRDALTYVRLFGTSSLRGVVLVDGSIWTKPDPGGYEGRATFLHNVQANRVRFTEQFVQSMYRKPQTKEYLSKIIADSLKTPTDAAVAMLAEMYLWNDLRPELQKVSVPLLIAVRAEHRDQAEIVQSIIPTAKAEVFEDAGHALFVDDASRFNALLGTFASSAFSNSR